MDLADVERAVGRSQEYFLEDGLWEIVTGLWLALTVALPAFLGGVVANWSPVAMLLGSLAIRPAVLAAKSRWVFPRTGRVTYPDPGGSRHSSLGLGLSPDRVVGGANAGRLDWVWAVSIGAAIAIPLARTRGLPRAGGFHVAVGVALGAAFLFAARRWGQRRWIATGVALAVLGPLIAASSPDSVTGLALHTAGIAAVLILSGAAAFAGYLREAPRVGADADGR